MQDDAVAREHFACPPWAPLTARYAPTARAIRWPEQELGVELPAEFIQAGLRRRHQVRLRPQ
jgi:hypothetical protein